MILSNDKEQKPEARLDEKNFVEEPLLAQLERLGWTVIRLQQVQQPGESFRQSFDEVVLRPELEKALRKINPFLTADQLADVVRRISDFPIANLIENNRQVLTYLLENTIVPLNQLTGEKSPTVRYVDFKESGNNSFIAIAQFKVRVPGTDHHIVPDVVLFVNGLPLVVIECKSPRVNEPIAEAIDQLLRYSQQRGDDSGGPEGNRALFYYNQFVIATCRDISKFGTITTHIEKHFFRWLDPYPLTLDELGHAASTSPNDQQRMIAGMCAPRNLLDLLRSFTIFGVDDKGQDVKIVARYQQFRAVKLIVKRLREGRNRDERGGIIWHTQGSGKSLTMMFTVREMRQHTELCSWKVVFVTDRTQLQDQLAATGQAIGYTVKEADSIAKLKRLLRNDSPDLVMAMMQKFQEREFEEIFPELNPRPNILLMIDEAHRTQYRHLAANLDRAVPQATRVAYTGTPIDKTEQTFGDYIDKYTMRQSIEDGTTLAIVYEGRTHNAEIPDKPGMDVRFEDVFSDYDLAERLQILGYGSREAYLEAEDVIRAKAQDMVVHYVRHVFPGGFKAQVVTTSQEAAVRYKAALDSAIQAMVAQLEQSNPLCINLDRLRTLETAVIISGVGHNERPHIKAYDDENYRRRNIKRFKLPFDKTEGSGEAQVDGRVGIIVVTDMLITGFDAPIEQVMYLDKVMHDHGLLQAIARVNRVGDEHKDRGFVVDYVGIGHHLKRALEAYDEREQGEILKAIESPDQAINELVQAHRELWELVKKYGLSDFSDMDAFYDLFYDEDTRFEYIQAFRNLSRAMNLVMPRKEALDYLGDYQRLVSVNEQANRHMGDGRLSMRGIPAKLRAITDEFLRTQGIEQKVAPISILDKDFEANVHRHARSKTKAAAVEHALRHFIEINLPSDPELFASFAKELERILREFAENWDRVYQELEQLRQRMMSKEQAATYGLDRRRQLPILHILKSELVGERALTEDEIAQNVNLTQHIYNTLTREVRAAGFWGAVPAQYKLRGELQDLFITEFGQVPGLFEKRRAIISRLMEWARENKSVLEQA